MVKVLIVDDLDSKIQSIRKVLVERCQITDDQIDEANSISSGVNALAAKQYQLLILDLVLPQFDGDQPEEKGGLSLLKDINDNSSVNLPVHIICLTEYAEIIKENQKEFDQLLVSSVVKHEGDTDWINQLAESVNYTIKLHNHLVDYYANKDVYDVGVICALQEEFDQMLIAFGEDKWKVLQCDNLPYQFKTCIINTESMSNLHVIAACAGGAGMVPTSILSTIMYNTFHVNKLFMTGFTGGMMGDDIGLGDILISKAVQNYPVGKVVDTEKGDVKLLKEMQQIPVNPQLISMVSDFVSDPNVESKLNAKIKKQNLQVNERESYKVECAPTVCVPFVLSSSIVQNELKIDNRKTLGIDMEGFALYYCAHQLSKQALWIKGVSDMANKDKNDKYHKTCAYGSAFLLQQFLKAKY